MSELKSDIEQRTAAIRKHLFLLCPNNSGSTYLSRAIATSPHVWSLEREGQHTFGFAGPTTTETPWALIWAGEEETLSYFRDSPDYDWARSKKAWYLQAAAHRHDAPVFHTRSPPFLSIADQLASNFCDPHFLLMVRNPYAALEGIVRRRTRAPLIDNPDNLARVAATHLMRCFAMQKQNIERLGERAIHFTYEQLCADPRSIAFRIEEFMPELGPLDLTQKLEVKGTYDEPLRNMNDDQIARLSQVQLDEANSVFLEHEELLSYFNYALIDGLPNPQTAN